MGYEIKLKRDPDSDEWVAYTDAEPFLSWLDDDPERARTGLQGMLDKIDASDEYSPVGNDGLTDRERAISAARYQTTYAHKYTSKRVRRALEAWRKSEQEG